MKTLAGLSPLFSFLSWKVGSFMSLALENEKLRKRQTEPVFFLRLHSQHMKEFELDPVLSVSRTLHCNSLH